jgi:nucleoside-diphosphate-sugar epimerase
MLEYNVTLEGKTILVTGAAGFIGSFLADRLLKEYNSTMVIGIDSITDYYDVTLKHQRLERLSTYGERFVFFHDSIANKAAVDDIFAKYHPVVVVNLAAQAGVRYSITNPDAYIESNLIGFYNILEACRHNEVEHLVYASSSSVYGSNKKIPYSTEDKVDNPVSLYAATKKSNELMAHAYSKLYNIPSTGLRFFTVYGPAGRPDMAYFGFTDKLVKGETIKIFNYGNCKRDFTYVDDIVEGVLRVMQHAPEKQNGEDGLPLPPYKVYNIGNNSPENLLDFVTILQEELIRAGVLPEDYDFEAHKELVPMQPGDVPVTYADTTPLEQDFGFKPSTPLRNGLRAFAEWYHKAYLGNERKQDSDIAKTKVEQIKARANIKVRRTMLDILNDDLGKKFKSLERLIDDCDKKTKSPNISLQRKNELLKKQVDLCLKANAYGRIINIVSSKLIEEKTAQRADDSTKENPIKENNNTTNVF